MPVGVRSIAMSVYVCLFLCLSVYLSARVPQKPHVLTSRNFMCMLSEPWLRSDDNEIRYVLPVLWMTSCFPIMGPMACGSGIGSIYVSAVLRQVVINFQRIRQAAPHCLTLLSYTVAVNYICAPGALAMTTCGALPLVGGLQRAV